MLLGLTLLLSLTGNKLLKEDQFKITSVKRGFNYPVYLTTKKNSKDLYIVEQKGIIKKFNQTDNKTTLFLNISNQVYYIEQTELGLLSLAFHPRNQENKLFYVYYTRTIKKKLYTVVEEFQEDNQGEISSNGILLQISQPYANHNGGQILFDDQEYLYIGLGDGGAAGDPHNNSQNLDSLLGKILRIDINKKSKDLSYSIPADNPFANSHDAKKEIWAYGLRNPWRFSIDNQTKLIYCGDVGQWKLEEIDIIKKGGNYGWNAFEGSLVYKEKHKKITHEEPIHTFGRNDGISVTGGYVYRGNNLKQLEGHYIYGDFESRNIWALLYDEKTKTVISNKILCKAPDRISSFGVDNDNEIYILGYDKGTIYRFAAN